MSLAELQRAFQSHIVASDPGVGERLTPQGRRGLPVYHHAYRATLRDTLRDTYARTALWMGDEAFDAAALAYVEITQSFSWTLGDYGGDFVRYLEIEHRSDPEIAELAWLEAALRAAFSSADPAPLGALGDVDWDHASFAFAPGVAARQVSTDVPGIWHALGEAVAPATYDLPSPIGLVVWRDGLSPQFRTTEASEAALLASLLAGAAFGEACAALVDVTADEVGGWLASWMCDRMIEAVRDPAGDD